MNHCECLICWQLHATQLHILFWCHNFKKILEQCSPTQKNKQIKLKVFRDLGTNMQSSPSLLVLSVWVGLGSIPSCRAGFSQEKLGYHLFWGDKRASTSRTDEKAHLSWELNQRHLSLWVHVKELWDALLSLGDWLLSCQSCLLVWVRVYWDGSHAWLCSSLHAQEACVVSWGIICIVTKIFPSISYPSDFDSQSPLCYTSLYMLKQLSSELLKGCVCGGGGGDRGVEGVLWACPAPLSLAEVPERYFPLQWGRTNELRRVGLCWPGTWKVWYWRAVSKSHSNFKSINFNEDLGVGQTEPKIIHKQRPICLSSSLKMKDQMQIMKQTWVYSEWVIMLSKKLNLFHHLKNCPAAWGAAPSFVTSAASGREIKL